MFINDEYKASGTDLESFRTEAEKIDANTSVVPMDFQNLKILSIFRYNPSERRFWCHSLAPGDYSVSPKTGAIEIPMVSIKLGDHVPDILRREAMDKETLFYYGGKMYFIGNTIYKSLAACQTGLGGKFLKSPGIERNLALIRQFEIDPPKVSAVVRHEYDCNKIVSVFRGKDYERSPFANLYDIAKETGLECHFWRITNQKAEIYLDRPEEDSIEGMRPGIYLETSDTGYVSTGASSVWRTEDFWYVQEKSKFDKASSAKKIRELEIRQEPYGERIRRSFRNDSKCSPSSVITTLKVGQMLGVKEKERVSDNMTDCDRYSNAVRYLIELPNERSLSKNQQDLYRGLLNNIVAQC